MPDHAVKRSPNTSTNPRTETRQGEAGSHALTAAAGNRQDGESKRPSGLQRGRKTYHLQHVLITKLCPLPVPGVGDDEIIVSCLADRTSNFLGVSDGDLCFCFTCGSLGYTQARRARPHHDCCLLTRRDCCYLSFYSLNP